MTPADYLTHLFGQQGRTAIVTGASSGLGLTFAKVLAGAGANVALMARRMDRLDALAAEIGDAGGTCLPLQADVQDPASIQAALEAVDAAYGSVDVLVNNAGVAPTGRAERHKLDEWEQTLRVNLTAVLALSQQVVKRMMARKAGGRIINISSVVGHAANPIFPTVAYTASKGGMEMMSRQMAIEWAEHGITVNCIAPGWFPTEMNTDPRYGDVHPKYKERMLQRIPTGRLGTPEELATALLYLASPHSSYSTGSTVLVDGGWLAG